MLYDNAERLAACWLDASCAVPVVLSLERTIDKPDGWIFFCDSTAFVESGDPLQAFGSNAPIIINRVTCEIPVPGTARLTEACIEEYEASLPKAQRQGMPHLRAR